MAGKHLFVFEGGGRCANATAYVLGVDESAAQQRLLREDASPYFVIARSYAFGLDLQAPGKEQETK